MADFPADFPFWFGADEPEQPMIDRYRDALLKLLPPGDGIAKWIGSNVYRLMEGLAIELARLHERTLDLLEEADPSTATELLTEWEETAGLPDECGAAETTEDRQATLVARLRGLGGHAQADYESVATALGVAVESVVRFPIARCSDPCDSTIRDPHWANVVKWRLTDAADATSPTTRVECEFNRRKRLHAHFLYGWIHPDTNVVADESGEAILDEAGDYVFDEGG
jgi:uncharacterized protein YmfQ (DUF2313 family)